MLTLVFIVINVLLILNISSRKVLNEDYIESEVSNVSVVDILYSSKLDNNLNIRKIRFHIGTVYSLCGILNLDDSKIEQIIDSKISKSIITTISVNIMNSLKNNTNYELYNIDDYNNLVDNNIDEVVKLDIPIIGTKGKEKISSTLKDTGFNIINDIPDTYTITKGIPLIRRVDIYLLSNNKVKYILIFFDVILLGLLFYVYRNIFMLLEISKLMILTDCVLIIFNILFKIYSNSFNGEWLFIRRCINYYNYSIIINEFIFIIISVVLFIMYKFLKRIIKI